MFDMESNSGDGDPRGENNREYRLFVSYILYSDTVTLLPVGYCLLVETDFTGYKEQIINRYVGYDGHNDSRFHFSSLSSVTDKVRNANTLPILINVVELTFCVHSAENVTHLVSAFSFITHSENEEMKRHKLNMGINDIRLEELTIVLSPELPFVDRDLMQSYLTNMFRFCNSTVFACIDSAGWDTVLNVALAKTMYDSYTGLVQK